VSRAEEGGPEPLAFPLWPERLAAPPPGGRLATQRERGPLVGSWERLAEPDATFTPRRWGAGAGRAAVAWPAGMCAQCMMTAMTAGAAATGTRAWIASREFAWLTPKRLRRITLGLLAAALIAASTISGT
jgi:hypothetical protein